MPMTQCGISTKSLISAPEGTSTRTRCLPTVYKSIKGTLGPIGFTRSGSGPLQRSGGQDSDEGKKRKSQRLFFFLFRYGLTEKGEVIGKEDEEVELDAPAFVEGNRVMKEHVEILSDMFQGDKPVLKLIRGKYISEALYLFGDASGLGFGSSWMKGQDIGYRYGVWGAGSDETSSNYRELRNLVETLERSGMKGELDG